MIFFCIYIQQVYNTFYSSRNQCVRIEYERCKVKLLEGDGFFCCNISYITMREKKRKKKRGIERKRHFIRSFFRLLLDSFRVEYLLNKPGIRLEDLPILFTSLVGLLVNSFSLSLYIYIFLSYSSNLINRI